MRMAGLSRKRRRCIAVVLYGFALAELAIVVIVHVLSPDRTGLLTGLLSSISVAFSATGILMSKRPDPRTTEELVSLVGEADRREIEALAMRGERVRAIRRLRDLTGLGLADTRRIYESMRP